MNDIHSKNKKIAVNTIIIYARLIITSIIGLVTVRYVLQALGASDYGLYNVAGGVVAMLNVISAAMQTTTRRYINVEMGKTDGNINKIFNISVVLHIGFSLFLLLIAETVGLYYIFNFLNVEQGRLSDALFVYQISTIVAVIGIMNVPYQGLLTAYENFKSLAVVDIIASLLKIPVIIGLIYYSGNHLRYYAIGMCLISLATFIIYHYICYKKYRDNIKFHFYKDNTLYKEILRFNNYTALGAFSYIGRTQGSNMLINYVFGTFINGLFAIAYQMESYLVLLVNNLSTSFDPQITQSYTAKDFDRCYILVSNTTRYAILIMLLFTFPLFINLEFVLKLWLGTIHSGVLTLCYWALVSLFVRSLTSGIPPLIIATGHIRAFQLSTTILMLVGLPISYFFFQLGFPYQTIIIIMTILDFLSRLFLIILVYKITHLNLLLFLKNTYKPLIIIMPFLVVFWLVIKTITPNNILTNLLLTIVSVFYCIIVLYLLGLKKEEKKIITNKIHI